MYTQCPECKSAFRVTADVLKVAAGMVRCGSCSHAFNSLDFLSEEKPQPKKPEIQLPELLPEPEDDVSLPDAPEPRAAVEQRKPPPRPQSISAEQSAALLKTLDQLAGEDVRIEDTGVEWRVLDDDDTSGTSETGESEADMLNDPEVTNAFFVGDIERYSEAAREEALAAENGIDHSLDPGLDPGQVGINESVDASQTPIDEDLSNDALDETRVDMDADVAEVFSNSVGSDNESYAQTGVIDAGTFNPLQTHVDEILHDSETPIHELVAPSAAEETPSSLEPEEEVLRFDDNTPLPDDFLDEEPELDLHNLSEPTIDDSQSFDASVTLGNPDEWQQLLNDFDDLLAGADDERRLAEELQNDAPELNAPPAVENAVADDAIDATEDETPGENIAEQDTRSADLSGDDWEPLPQLGTETALADEDDEHPVELLAEQTPEADDEELGSTSTDDEQAIDVADDGWESEPAEEEHAKDLDLSQILDPDDDGLVDAGESDPERDDSDLPDVLNLGDDVHAVDAAARDKTEADDDYDLPEQSEEEQTINMLIDQDLLSIAREDEDGFTSTIVFEEGVDPLSASSIHKQNKRLMEETILSEEDLDDDAVAVEELLALEKQAEASSKQHNSKRKGIWLGAAAILVIALGGQAIHQFRDQLATTPGFRSVLAPIYDGLGMPLDPDWDVSGWAIERTQGATDGKDQLLTIISELRNRTGKPMPYPIITVSLTNRSQDPVGSLVVEPKDYLSDGDTIDTMVAGGVQFQARIPVDAPPGEASGYTINACYRIGGNELRCANEDFLR